MFRNLIEDVLGTNHTYSQNFIEIGRVISENSVYEHSNTRFNI